MYARKDTEILYRTIVAFSDIVYERIAHINRIGLTLPSTALKAFQTGYLDRNIRIPENAADKEILREGYHGGRVEVFKAGYYPTVYVYDFNSLYPAVMATTPVPVSGQAIRTQTFHRGKSGCYRLRFRQLDRNKLPLLLHKGIGVYEGEGVYFEPEIRRLLDSGGEVEIIDGVFFRDSDVIFKAWVDKLYSLRMEDKDSPLGNACKLLMNSLYGKFGQKPERMKTLKAGVEEIKQAVKAGKVVDCISPKHSLYRISEEMETEFEHVGIAGTITSEARARLWEAFNAGVVYCDTDSVHTTIPKPHNETQLGSLKLEYEGEGVYVGKKLYALRNANGEKVKAKGIRVGGDNGFSLDFDSLATLLDGAKIACSFRTANTPKSVLKGKAACTFVSRTRTIRKTA
jgi:hypothetical protein